MEWLEWLGVAIEAEEAGDIALDGEGEAQIRWDAAGDVRAGIGFGDDLGAALFSLIGRCAGEGRAVADAAALEVVVPAEEEVVIYGEVAVERLPGGGEKLAQTFDGVRELVRVGSGTSA